MIGNGRTLQNDTTICGYRVPKGVSNFIINISQETWFIIICYNYYLLLLLQVQVVFPTVVTGNMEQYVTDAKTFKPMRWLKESSDESLHPFASLPYGHGARMCLGRRFADLEIQVLLAKV